MTNEMKLLTALCNALGFEVKREVKVIKGLPFKSENLRHIENIPGREFERISSYESVEIKREIEYRLIKSDVSDQ